MSIPTDIALAIGTAIRAAIASAYPEAAVFIDGVSDTDSPQGDRTTLPAVYVRAAECGLMQYRSVMREYPVTVMVATHHGQDRDQAALFGLSALVVEVLATSTFSITSSHFDALHMAGAAIRSDEGLIQTMTWECSAKVRKT